MGTWNSRDRETVSGTDFGDRMGVVADSSRNPLSTRSMWRATVGNGAFEMLIADEFPITPITARRFMVVAEDDRIRAHVHILPPSWGTLYELTKLDDDEFAAAIIDGTRRGQRDIGSPAKTHPRCSYGLGRLKNAPPSTTIQLWERAHALAT